MTLHIPYTYTKGNIKFELICGHDPSKANSQILHIASSIAICIIKKQNNFGYFFFSSNCFTYVVIEIYLRRLFNYKQACDLDFEL